MNWQFWSIWGWRDKGARSRGGIYKCLCACIHGINFRHFPANQIRSVSFVSIFAELSRIWRHDKSLPSLEPSFLSWLWRQYFGQVGFWNMPIIWSIWGFGQGYDTPLPTLMPLTVVSQSSFFAAKSHQS